MRSPVARQRVPRARARHFSKVVRRLRMIAATHVGANVKARVVLGGATARPDTFFCGFYYTIFTCGFPPSTPPKGAWLCLV